jgi:tetratricopeptide (TPR) repeat protein
LARDALKAADRAVELAANESAAWLYRAVVKNLSQLIEHLVTASTGSEVPPDRVGQALFPREALTELSEAARLAPGNARLQGVAAMYAVMTVAAERGASSLESLMSSGAWSLLDEAGQRRLRTDMGRLEALTTSGDPAAAAAAWELLGVVQMLGTRELNRSNASFRQALRLDPERDSAWEGLVALLVIGERFDELATLCEEKLQKRDSARARLLLAKAYERTRDYATVLATLEPATRRFPDDFLINLATAAAILRVGTDDTSLAQAAQLIGRAEKVAGDSPTPEQMVSLLVARGLFFGLLNQSEPARANLEKALETDPSRDDVREALTLLR